MDTKHILNISRILGEITISGTLFLNSRIVLKTDQPHLFIISRNFLGGNKRSKMVFNMGSILTGSTINIRKMRISVLSESKIS